MGLKNDRDVKKTGYFWGKIFIMRQLKESNKLA
jgi:hypothetical protein